MYSPSDHREAIRHLAAGGEAVAVVVALVLAGVELRLIRWARHLLPHLEADVDEVVSPMDFLAGREIE